jgi:hypothetical protein
MAQHRHPLLRGRHGAVAAERQIGSGGLHLPIRLSHAGIDAGHSAGLVQDLVQKPWQTSTAVQL